MDIFYSFWLKDKIVKLPLKEKLAMNQKKIIEQTKN